MIAEPLGGAHKDFDTTAAALKKSLLKHLAPYGTYTLHPQIGRTFPSLLPARTLDYIFSGEPGGTLRNAPLRLQRYLTTSFQAAPSVPSPVPPAGAS